jgi:hypothetical protein
MSEADVAAITRTAISAQAAEEGIWPDNVATVEAFLAVETQWRWTTVGGGGFAPARMLAIGLDYAGVLAGLLASGITHTPALFAGIRLMEAEAREALNGFSR